MPPETVKKTNRRAVIPAKTGTRSRLFAALCAFCLLQSCVTLENTPDAAAPKNSAPVTGAPVTGAPDTGAPDTGAPDTGAPDTGKRIYELSSGMKWLNTTYPLNMYQFDGHVILLNFWTYCSINCIHVIDDLRKLDEKYKNEPFVLIGIHSPRFQNEKTEKNLRSALLNYGIKYPVVMDNDFAVWELYGLKAWPSFIVADTAGRVILETAGEGKLGALDAAISAAIEEGRKNGTLAKQKRAITPEYIHEEWKKPVLSFPSKLEIDSGRYLYVSDTNHDRILRIRFYDAYRGRVEDVIGSGATGNRDGGFPEALFNRPHGMASRDNILYVADTGNNTIRRIDTITKTVTTVAGTGRQGYARTFSGNALEAALNSPLDVCVDAGGTYLYVAMAGGHQLWRMHLLHNIIEDFAGNGTENLTDGGLKDSSLSQPGALAFYGEKLFFADSGCSGLRYVDTLSSRVKTLCGKGLFYYGFRDGPFENALLQYPLGICSANGMIYIADTFNNAVREADIPGGNMRTIAHAAQDGTCAVMDRKFPVTPLSEPGDVLFFEDKLYIADTNNHIVRVLDLKLGDLRDFEIIE